MTDPILPPCGLYRTVRAIGEVPAGKLVYFHNHGDPGAGLYLPSGWQGNRARFHERGHMLADPADAGALEPLAPEGFYRVVSAFHCCERRCRQFLPDALVQLGYDADANAIVFVPELVDGLLGLPDRGTRIDRHAVANLARLHVATSRSAGAAPPDAGVLH